jgi:large subunit ribosomal protein L10
MFDSLNNVTALMFSENPKEPALILSSFRTETKGEKPELKAAFINGDIYSGDNSLVTLTKIKTKNELIGEVIGLLQSPAKRVLAALLHHHEKAGATAEAGTTAEAGAPEAGAADAPAAE